MRYQPFLDVMFAVQACGEKEASYFIGANKVTQEEWEQRAHPKEGWWL